MKIQGLIFTFRYLQKKLEIIGTFFLMLLFIGCKEGVEIKELNLFENYQGRLNDTSYVIDADLSDAVYEGVVIPTIRQTQSGYFRYSFHLINHSNDATHYWYKLYYQNETYKREDSLSGENFYGSWEDTGIEFKATREFEDELVVTDSFRIVGNPRNERIFYGRSPEQSYITPGKIEARIAYIRTQSEWDKRVRENSVVNKVSYEQQIYSDALWSLNDENSRITTHNNRWKRNPRVGNYRFMLVVCSDEDLIKIPEWVKNISLKDSVTGLFRDPFLFFRENRPLFKKSVIEMPSLTLNVKVKLDPEQGIYVDRLKFPLRTPSREYYTTSCNDSVDLYRKAQFSQYFHTINKAQALRNIKEMRDVTGENYTRSEYEAVKKKYEESGQLTDQYMNITDCPCKTVSIDKKEKSITIRNPGNEGQATLKKEQVGITSRIGLTYGKWRAKIKFPKLISEDNVWNGLTAAYWLIFQDEANWNLLRPCENRIAYIPKHLPDEESSVWKSTRQNYYSEIDFEIIKESAYWPASTYKNGKVPSDQPYNTNDITVTCTNWDLACHQPKNFLVGAKDVTIEGKTYHFGRWSDYYKAITSKIQVDHNELLGGDYYYYEIDWQPARIIWRIGKDKAKMREICRMDKQFTSIPNNQMVMVLTQEFHYQEWWPLSPFKQNFIPFPKKDLVGKLLELEVE